MFAKHTDKEMAKLLLSNTLSRTIYYEIATLNDNGKASSRNRFYVEVSRQLIGIETTINPHWDCPKHINIKTYIKELSIIFILKQDYIIFFHLHWEYVHKILTKVQESTRRVQKSTQGMQNKARFCQLDYVLKENLW